MGLVATWLSGIGLAEAVPTFQAAGIITPSALAELDVAHFEALGVSDPDDRRKLFYLVQRIKMAVNKQADEATSSSASEQVDAVVQGSLISTSEKPQTYQQQPSSPSNSKSNNGQEASESKESSPSFEPKDAPEYREPPKEQEPPTPVRRSRRIAGKHENKSSNPAAASSTTQTNGQEMRNENQIPKSSQNHSDDGGSSNLKKSSSKDSKDHQEEEEDDASKLQSLRSKRRLLEKRHSRSSFSSATAPDIDVKEKQEEKEVREPVPKADPAPKPEASSSAIDDTTTTKIQTKPKNKTTRSNVIQRRKSLSKLQSPKKFTAIKATTSAEPAAPAPPKSKMPAPKSRIQNPSKSVRTGKQLSAIPSDTVPPITPLVDRSASQMDKEVQEQETMTLQKSSTEDSSLESSSLSSASVQRQISFTESADNNDGNNSVSSRGSSSSRRRRQSSVGRKSESSSAHRRKSSISAPPAAIASKATTSSSAPMVHGGAEADNWRTKVEHLREDNDAEHTLFCDQADKELFDYDMRIRVIVRKRPVSKSEANLSGGIDVIHPLDYGDYGRILVYQPKTRVDLTKEIETIPFSYDNVFGEDSTNVQIYDRSVRNLIYPFFEGQMTTVFAYGQTGSGKTYTMMGSNMTGVNAGTAKHDESNLGLYYLAALDIFEMLRRPENSHLALGVSLFEIYGGKLFDLINGRKHIKCLEDSRGKVCFPGLTEHPVSGPDQLMELINEGATNRSTGTTSRNADSSRSHAVLQLSLRKTVGRKKSVEHGRMTFIDLAGSERGADTSSCSRATRLEGAEINTSLLALKEVIRALATGGNMTHIPFRGSKLTQVLKDSFVGERSKCCMVACISPDIGNCDQTLNTLRYADRVKERNPETGGLAPGYEQPTRLRPPGQAQLPSPLNSEQPDDDDSLIDPSENSPTVSDLRENSFQRTFSAVSDGGDTAVLDDLLSSSSPESSIPALAPTEDSEAPGPKSSKDRAGDELIAAHRSVMASMLSMVKNEMALVNKVDADRDGLDEYLVELEKIHRTQMEYVTTLRNSLHNYVNKIESADGGAQSDEDSFEDLRD